MRSSSEKSETSVKSTRETLKMFFFLASRVCSSLVSRVLGEKATMLQSRDKATSCSLGTYLGHPHFLAVPQYVRLASAVLSEYQAEDSSGLET